MLYNVMKILLIIICAPIIGGLLTGIDRKLSARLQGRQGPPLLQPFYDVVKLLQKEATAVSMMTRFFITFSLLFNVLTVVCFFMGADLLLCIFAYTLAATFFVIAGYSSHSPYSFMGTGRELLQIMAYEPMVMITAFCFYKVSGSFSIIDIAQLDKPMILQLPLIFLGFMYVLTIKLRKSPFNLSMSHHAHQELVAGISTELTGVCLAMTEVTHWYETVFSLGFIYLFFRCANPISIPIALALCLVVYCLETFIENNFARVKWKMMLLSSWLVTFIVGAINMYVLFYVK